MALQAPHARQVPSCDLQPPCAFNRGDPRPFCQAGLSETRARTHLKSSLESAMAATAKGSRRAGVARFAGGAGGACVRLQGWCFKVVRRGVVPGQRRRGAIQARASEQAAAPGGTAQGHGTGAWHRGMAQQA
jgi:hypothetical protein